MRVKIQGPALEERVPQTNGCPFSVSHLYLSQPTTHNAFLAIVWVWLFTSMDYDFMYM